MIVKNIHGRRNYFFPATLHADKNAYCIVRKNLSNVQDELKIHQEI